MKFKQTVTLDEIIGNMLKRLPEMQYDNRGPVPEDIDGAVKSMRPEVERLLRDERFAAAQVIGQLRDWLFGYIYNEPGEVPPDSDRVLKVAEAGVCAVGPHVVLDEMRANGMADWNKFEGEDNYRWSEAGIEAVTDEDPDVYHAGSWTVIQRKDWRQEWCRWETENGDPVTNAPGEQHYLCAVVGPATDEKHAGKWTWDAGGAFRGGQRGYGLAATKTEAMLFADTCLLRRGYTITEFVPTVDPERDDGEDSTSASSKADLEPAKKKILDVVAAEPGAYAKRSELVARAGVNRKVGLEAVRVLLESGAIVNPDNSGFRPAVQP